MMENFVFGSEFRVQSSGLEPLRKCLVIASPVQPGVAIQMDCFVASLLAMTFG